MKRSKYTFYFSITILVIVLTSFAFNQNVKLDNQDIIGKWGGSIEGADIVLEFSDRNRCSVTFENDILFEILKGECEINTKKIPFSLTIRNIETKPYSLHTLIRKTSKDTVEITNFSSEWRLRELNFASQNTIVLKNRKEISK
jgi:hypothetical protein